MMTLEDYMEDVIEPEMHKASKAKARSKRLDALLEALGDMAPKDPKFQPQNAAKSWAGIVEASLKVPKYAQACKQCHALYKKPYKKAYHQREVAVDSSLEKK